MDSEVLAVQFDLAWQDPAVNAERAVGAVECAGGISRGGLIVLPEMFGTGFSMDIGVTAVERSMDLALGAAADLARRWDAWVVAGLTVRGGWSSGRPGNAAAVIDPSGEVRAACLKARPFSPAGEDTKYEPGESPLVFEWGGLRVSPFVCYDLRFPELFRQAVDLGAEVFVVIANWPSARQGHWDLLLQARAIENQAWVIGVNRCGRDPTFEYLGGSAVIDPEGRRVAQAGTIETCLRARISPEAVRSWRERFPALRDRAAAAKRRADRVDAGE